MSTIEHAFDTPHPIRLQVAISAGSVEVDLADVATAQVTVTGRDAEEVRVELDGDELRVLEPRGRTHSYAVGVTAPLGSDVAARTGSADVAVRGECAQLVVKTGSGDVAAERLTGESRVDTGSGDVAVGEAHAPVAVKCGSGDVALGNLHHEGAVSTGSGDVVVERAERALALKTGSGDLAVGEVHDDVEASTGSGDVEVRTLHRGRLTVRTASGGLRAGVLAGVPVYTDVQTVTGRIASDLQGAGRPEAGQAHVEVHVTTVSGDVVLEER